MHASSIDTAGSLGLKMKNNSLCNIGAKIATNTSWGVPYYKYGLIGNRFFKQTRLETPGGERRFKISRAECTEYRSVL